MMTEEINVALITDANYFNPALVTIKSMLNSTKRKVNIKCIITEVLAINIKDLEKKIENEFKNVTIEFLFFDDSILSNVKTKWHVSRAAYVKIYLPKILSNWNKCIFLDSDLLVRKDIGILWDHSIDVNSNYEIAAVWNPGYNKDNKVIGLDLEDKTFNSGVLVMNLKVMRENNSSLKLEQFIKEFNHLTVLNDQAAFNAIYKKNWMELPLEWNVQYLLYLRRKKVLNISKEELSLLRKNPAIIHFTTSSKPWKYRSLHPYKKEFLNYYKVLQNSEYLGKITIIDTIKKVREVFLLVKGTL